MPANDHSLQFSLARLLRLRANQTPTKDSLREKNRLIHLKSPLYYFFQRTFSAMDDDIYFVILFDLDLHITIKDPSKFSMWSN